MTSAMLADLLKACAVLSGLLMAGTVLRAKVPLFRKLLLPASVIGGFIGLLLGPNVMGQFLGFSLLPIPEDYVSIWSIIPGILIVPIFAAAPLGDGMDKKANGKKGSFKQYGPGVIVMMAVFSMVGSFQSATGYITNLFFKHVGGMDLYRTFGWELSQGFAGGHGTAAAIGGILEGYGLDFWQTAQGVGVTTATVGLLGGMILGIVFINRAARKGEVSNLRDIPEDTQRGIITDVEKQKSMGRETTVTSCINTATIHLGLILIGCGLAYWLRGILSGSSNEVIQTLFSAPPVWFYALLLMYVVNFVLIKFDLGWMIDKKVKSSVTGCLSDFAITAAIASCNVKAVIAYIVPILVMCAIGFVVTYFGVFAIHKKVFGDDYAFERSIICWGTNTGVMVTGMMLLKICDPDFETPALTDFSMGFAIMSIISIFTSPITYGLIGSGSTLVNLGWNIVQIIAYAIVIIIAGRLYKKNRANA